MPLVGKRITLVTKDYRYHDKTSISFYSLDQEMFARSLFFEYSLLP